MSDIETTGRTLEEAVQAAAQELGVGTDGVDYEIVEEGNKGFLGLGQVPTTIHARVKEGYVPAAPSKAGAVPIEDISEDAAETGNQDEVVKASMKMVRDVVKAMGLEADVVLKSASEEEVYIDIIGKDCAILIGKHGQTLDALQYLLGLMLNRDFDTRRRVTIDAEGYRARHQELLEHKAKEYADAVRAEGKEAVLDPQSPRDRRIIHMALADDPDVYTYSEGMGDNRHVVISPKKQSD